jgi:type IV secretion system protein VirB2
VTKTNSRRDDCHAQNLFTRRLGDCLGRSHRRARRCLAGTGQKRRKIAAIGKGASKEHYPREANRGEATRDKVVADKGIAIGRLAGVVAAAFWSGAAVAQDAMADPAGSGVIVSAVRWLEGTLLGTIATVVAVIAVASVGLLMLTGRINWRYGATVILGCFILFGAASIVAGIQSTATLGR